MTEQQAVTRFDWFFRIVLALLAATVVVSALVAAPETVHPRPSVQTIQGKYEPVVIYDANERQLTVTPAMPRDALVCLRGRCLLVEEWMEGRK